MPRRLFALFIAAAITLLFFYKLAFSDMILGRGDTYTYFYPYWDARNEALAQGRLPLWSPDVFMGSPLLADPQLGTFYPPNWLHSHLNAPEAVRHSILLHVLWAIVGTYLLARRALLLDRLAALAAGTVFGLSGYLGAHVEQINQLQGLAWLPWLFLLFHQAQRKPLRFIPLLGAGIALQGFTGHTQTVFITLVGLGMYALLRPETRRHLWWRRAAFSLLTLMAAVLLAVLLAVPQLVPTLELMGFSNRSGGLNQHQATAFSLSPLVAGRGLLPSYDSQLFSEYVAYIGLVALGLAVIGVLHSGEETPPTVHMGGTTGVLVHDGGRISSGLGARLRRGLPHNITWLVLALVGLLMAFGFYNPLYWLLAGLPGFNLFRVPARWLVLFALGGALLAGLGLHTLARSGARPSQRVFTVIILLALLLMGASFLMHFAPAEDITGPAAPTFASLVVWSVTVAVVVFGLWLYPRFNRPGLWVGALLLELFVAAQALPYNRLTPPEVYTGRRFSISQMQVYLQQDSAPGRVLSISELQFDPGDKLALEARFAALGMDELAVRNALVAVKRQEMLFPNLSLAWHIPSVDGYGGGLLPTGYYTQFSALALPPDEPRSIDGRLGELLARAGCFGACVPELWWLEQTDTRYLIRDKVYDLVKDGIFYDVMQSEDRCRSACPIYSLPDFEADAVDVIYEGDSPLILTFAGAGLAVESRDDINGLNWVRYRFDRLINGGVLNIQTRDSTVYAVTLVDTRTGDFSQLSPEPWQRALSSDVKIYRRTSASSRVFLAQQITYAPDTFAGGEAALSLLREHADQPGFVVLHNADSLFVRPADPRTSGAQIVRYEPELVEIRVESAQPALLVLVDAYYPGWEAQVNEQLMPIYRVNVMFRAVEIPAGESRVVFEYRPAWLPVVLWFGGIMWAALAGMLVLLWRKFRFS